MHSQVLTTARLGVIKGPETPPDDIKSEVAQVAQWFQVSLPGSVLQALSQNGVIEDPLKDFTARQLGWVAESRFLYLIPFKAQKRTKTLQNAFLVLEGLDTHARVYLNGRQVMRSSNALCRWEAEITPALRWGADNILIVVMDPLIPEKSDPNVDRAYDPMGHPERLGMRRCQMSFGWDSFPSLAGPGIRRGIRIDYRGPAWIEDVWIHTIYARPGAAYMELNWRVRSTTTRLEDPLRLTLRVDKNGVEEKFVVPVEKFKISTAGFGRGFYDASGTETITWASPPFWFPHTHGEPNLHEVEADLRYGGVLWDRRRERFGIRVVEIERKQGNLSRETMRLVINGSPIVVRGANWVPGDGLLLDTEPRRLESLLRKAKNLGINLLRVWGGGLYESEDFYRLCDEMGILVWQDFPFASGPYPAGDERFLANVKWEATDNVRRLRRHPSLALLCGNAAVRSAYFDTPDWNRRGPLDCEALFTEHLPALCAAEAPGVPYVEGSPSGGDYPNEPRIGDHHAWDWWMNIQAQDWVARLIPSFLSEFGVPTAPDPRTLEQYVTHRHHHLASGIAEHTIKHHQARMLKHLEAEEPRPEWDRFLARGWELQTRLLTDVIERLRAAPDECGGTLIWTLNESYPGFSFSLFDYAVRPKPAAVHVQQAYADILMRFVEDESPLELRVVNDRSVPLEGAVRVTLISLEGECLYEEELPVKVQARGMAVPWCEALEAHTHLPRTAFLVTARLEHADGVVRTHYYPVPVPKLLLPRAEVILTVRPGKSETALQFRSDQFVRWILVQTDAPGSSTALFGFDLVPGEPVVCNLSPKARSVRVSALSPGLKPQTIDLQEKQSIAWNE